MKKLLRLPIKPLFSKDKKGFTLIELLVSLGLFGIVFLAAFQIMGLGTQFSNDFVRSSKATSFVAEAMNLLNTMMPQVTRIDSVLCRGTTMTKDNAAFLDTANTAVAGDLTNYWFDPAIDGAHANDGSFVTIFDAEVDTYFGGTDSVSGEDETRLEYITSDVGYGGTKTCRGFGNRNNMEDRGCPQRLRLLYAAPVVEVGATPSEPGQLIIRLSDLNSANTSTDHEIVIGGAASRVGIARLSCGMPQRDTGSNDASNRSEFVLNIRVKFKNSYVNITTDSQYESWHPEGTNHYRGARREIKMRFAMPNLNQRGAYQWKMQSLKGCIVIGATAAHPDQCCSTAMTAGGLCATCIRSGQASASANNCCSGMLNGANCL